MMLSANTALHGVTIITHGFNSNADSWVDAMADEVIARIAAETAFQESDVAKYELTIDSSSVSLAQESTESYLTAASGETVIRLDWGALSSNTGLSTSVTAGRIADYIFASATWIAEAPLHLLGHSRGASLVNAIAAELGEGGVAVDHLTFFDAVPVGGDYPMNIPQNVIFADGYWRTGGIFTPDGQAVTGAYNIELNESHFAGGTIGYGGISDVHSDVHLWYHGTVDNVGGFSDGEETVADEDAGYWFQPAAYDAVDGPVPAGRDDTGFSFSRAVGFPRAVAGVTTFIGGSGARTALDWSGANWPNIVELTIDAGDLEFDVGDAIPVDYYFQDADSNADLSFFLDLDGNPHNGNAVAVGSPILQNGGMVPLTSNSQNVPTDGVSPGTYYLAVRIADAGGRQRWVYAPGTITLNATAPVLVSTTINGGSVNRSGIGMIAFAFSEAVTITATNSFNLYNHTTASSANLAGAMLLNNTSTTVTLDLTGLTTPLADGDYTLELPADQAVNGSAIPLETAASVQFHKLAGDVNGSRTVSFDDYGAVQANFAASVTPFGDGDANGSGVVSFDDYGAVQANFASSLPAMLRDVGDAPASASLATSPQEASSAPTTRQLGAPVVSNPFFTAPTDQRGRWPLLSLWAESRLWDAIRRRRW